MPGIPGAVEDRVVFGGATEPAIPGDPIERPPTLEERRAARAAREEELRRRFQREATRRRRRAGVSSSLEGFQAIWAVIVTVAALVQFAGIAIAGSSYHRVLLLAAIVTTALLLRRLNRRR